MATDPGRLWGRQYPFERQHLQRNMTMLGLAGVLSVTVILLLRADPARALGGGLVCAGMVCALGAVSRHRYVRETRRGFAILASRDGRFVFGSAAAFLFVAVCVLLLVVV
jgi:multisubunit Na+/H+ antiporter MnhB subunit